MSTIRKASKSLLAILSALTLTLSLVGNPISWAADTDKHIDFEIIVDQDETKVYDVYSKDIPVQTQSEDNNQDEAESVWIMTMPTSKDVADWMKKEGIDPKKHDIEKNVFYSRSEEPYDFGKEITFDNGESEILRVYVYTDVTVTYKDGETVLDEEVVKVGQVPKGIEDPKKTGVTFEGWYKDKKYSKEFDLTQKLNDDTTVYAKFSDETYSIHYDLNKGNGSTQPQFDSEKNSYTEKETFTLEQPTREGYEFEGWTGSNGQDPEKEVTIEKGTTKDLEFVAHWRPKEVSYTVLYQTTSGKELKKETQKGSFDQTIIVEPIVFEDYEIPEAQEITLDSMEEKDVVFEYGLVEYTIAYDYKGGQIEGENPTIYNQESSQIEIQNPEKQGYTFTGWSGTGLTGNNHMEVKIPTGSKGNREYIAHYSPIQYTLHFEGTNHPLEDLKATYDQDVTLPDGKQAGRNICISFETYGASKVETIIHSVELKGWAYKENTYGAGQVINSLTTKDKETITLTAVYDESGYTITLPTPTKEGQIFDGWYKDATLKEKVGNGGDTWTTTSDAKLYAKWKVEGLEVVGQGATWTKGSKQPLEFTIKGSENDKEIFKHFQALFNNTKKLNNKAFTATEGSVKLSINPDFLQTLSAGKHTFTATFDDGRKVDLHFTIQKEKLKPSEKTDGQKTGVYHQVPVYSGSLIAATWALLKLRKKNN